MAFTMRDMFDGPAVSIEVPPEAGPTDRQQELITDLRRGQAWLYKWHHEHRFRDNPDAFLEILDEWAAKELGLQNLFGWKLCINHPERCPDEAIVRCNICVGGPAGRETIVI